MLLFYRYSRRTLLFLAVILAVEYAIVYRISLDALTRSDIGLSQWRTLLTDCNASDCEVRHLTLIHDGLYQRAYSAHLLHRVLAISSEDGDPYDAFDDDDVEGDDESVEGDDDESDVDETGLVPSLPDMMHVPYAYAPGDMLSTPPPVLPSPGSRPNTTLATGAVDAVPALLTLTAVVEQTTPSLLEQHETHQQQQQRLGLPAAVSTPAAATAADGAASGSPRLLQAVVWQPSKVLSVFPWQLRAHFFLSLASTRMYLLMGLWPRAAAVAAAAPRRLRQQAHAHSHHFQQQQQHPNLQHPPPHQAMPGQGQDQAAGGVSSSQPPYSYMATTGVFSHPHAQAQATAHAYAQHAYGYDSLGGGLYGLGRTPSDESQSLAAALSALGRGLPVFLPPEMLVEHGVQEDLMASCVFQPAAKNAPSGMTAMGGGGDSGFSGEGSSPLPRWRTWSSLLSRWVARLAGRIKHHGGRAAAKLRAAGVPIGSPPPPTPPALARNQLPQSDADGGGGGARTEPSANPRGAPEQQQQPQGAGPSGSTGAGAAGAQPPQQHSYAYVECRLYRTDRARNVSYTCPAVLTVLPSPPRGSLRSALYHRLLRPHQHQQHHHHHQQQPHAPGHGAGGAAQQQPQPPHPHPQQHGPRPRAKPRLLRRLWLDLWYMAYGVVMPYKWAPILAGVISPHMFLLACLPALHSLGLMGPFTARLFAYHAVCIALTGADHLLLLRLASELWMRARAPGGPAGRSWRQWLVLGKWLLVDGFLSAGWMFRTVAMGIITTKQMELWTHLYGASFQPHPLLSFCLVLPASWVAASACCSAAYRLAAGHQPMSAPLLLFQEGFLSGLSSPVYSLVYISFAVLGLGGGGVGGGARSVLGLTTAGVRLPLWLLDAVAVSPVLTVVALDVLWNTDAAARATPLLMVIVNALRAHQAQDEAAGPFGRRGRGLLGGAVAAAAAGGGGGGGGGGGALGWLPPRGLAAREVGGAATLKQHTSLWMLLEPARWWAHHVRDAVEEEHRMQEQQQNHHANGAQAGPAGGGGNPRGLREHAALAVARVAVAARQAGMVELPRGVIAGMMAAMLLPPPGEPWPPRQAEQAHALDLLLEAAAEAAAPVRRGRGGAAGGGGGFRGGAGGEEELDMGVDMDADGIDELFMAAGEANGGGAGAAEGGERMVRGPDGSLRPLSALEAELRAGLAQVAALRSQLAAVGRGVADLLLLGRWPPPLELPAEALGWCESVPHGFLCPITHSLMTQPALLVSPQLSEASPTYELSAIRQWLRSNRTDPTTGRYLHNYHFIHNDNLRKAIEDWVQDRLAREQQQQQQRHSHQQQQQLRQRQPHLSPVAAGRPQRAAAAAGSASPLAFGSSQRSGAGAGAGAARMRSPARGRLLQPSAGGTAPAAAAAAAAAGSVAAGGTRAGRYHPVAGPGPGQRSVCVGTSEMGLRMQSPERGRSRGAAAGQPGSGGAALAAGGHARGRSRSRGRALRPAGQAAAAEGGVGAGGGAAAVLARQVVQRAASRQRGLQRALPQ